MSWTARRFRPKVDNIAHPHSGRRKAEKRTQYHGMDTPSARRRARRLLKVLRQ